MMGNAETIKDLNELNDLIVGDEYDKNEPRCPRCGETKANHGNYASGEDWTCPDQDGYGYKPTRHR
jgi:ribosomal protein S27AE